MNLLMVSREGMTLNSVLKQYTPAVIMQNVMTAGIDPCSTTNPEWDEGDTEFNAKTCFSIKYGM